MTSSYNARSSRPQRRAKPRDAGFVYVIAQEGDWGLYKVGHAGDVDRRLRELQTGAAKNLVALRRWPTHNMRQSEKRMHALLATHHVRGEWFRCPVKVIDLAWRQTMAVKP